MKTTITKFITLSLLAISATAALSITVFKPTVTIVGPDGRNITVRLQDTPSAWPANAAAVRVMPPNLVVKPNAAALMKVKTGASVPRERDTTYVPNILDENSAGGLFRTVCHSSHMLFDDPIVYPGQPGKSHLHTFFGNSDVNGNTNVAGTNLASFGRSTCFGGTINRSGYWVPALVDIRTGKPVQPDLNIVYYKNDTYFYGNTTPERRALVQVPPSGLRMIAGSPANATDFYGTNTGLDGIYAWECINTPTSNPNTGYPHHKGGNIPLECNTGDDLTMTVQFPDCWDGVNLDSPGHGAGTVNGVPGHMAYGDYYTGCPSTHPVKLPVISFHVRYNLRNSADLPYLRLASDNYAAATGNAGRSAHGDWINGWDQAYLAKIRTNCWMTKADCSVGFSNDGKTIY